MKKILIVVDMKNDFIDGALGTKEAEKIVDHVVNKINEFQGKIFVTYDTHLDNYMDTREGKMLPVPHCIKDTEGWKLNSKVENALKNKDVTKIEKITFGSVDLPKLVGEYTKDDVFEVEMVGLCTDICVVSNAILLKANYPEAEISVDSSCCAGVTVDTHNAALETMKMCQIIIK